MGRNWVIFSGHSTFGIITINITLRALGIISGQKQFWTKESKSDLRTFQFFSKEGRQITIHPRSFMQAHLKQNTFHIIDSHIPDPSSITTESTGGKKFLVVTTVLTQHSLYTYLKIINCHTPQLRFLKNPFTISFFQEINLSSLAFNRFHPMKTNSIPLFRDNPVTTSFLKPKKNDSNSFLNLHSNINNLL